MGTNISLKQKADFTWELKYNDQINLLRDINGHDLLWLAETSLLESGSPLIALAIYDRLVINEGFLPTDLPIVDYYQILQIFQQDLLDQKIMTPDVFLELVYMIQGQKFGSDILEWFSMPLTLIISMRAVLVKYPRQTL